MNRVRSGPINPLLFPADVDHMKSNKIVPRINVEMVSGHDMSMVSKNDIISHNSSGRHSSDENQND